MQRNLLLFLILLALPALARVETIDQPPGHLPAGPDEAIFGTTSPRQFFADRQTDSRLAQCRANLTTQRETYQRARTTFRDLLQRRQAGQVISDTAIDQSELGMQSARKQFLALETECGYCAVRKRGPMRLRNPPLTQAPVYYESDGSCQLTTTDTATLLAAYTRWRESLHRPRDYPRRTGGFTNVDEFLRLNGTTIVTNDDPLPSDGTRYRAFVAVPGPNVPNPFGTSEANRTIRTSFSYVYEAWTEPQANSTTIRFETPMPLIQINREVRRVSASGARNYVTRQNFVVRMRRVLGMWHLTQDGYLRYRTVADFGIAMESAAQIGKEMLSETILEMMERGT